MVFDRSAPIGQAGRSAVSDTALGPADTVATLPTEFSSSNTSEWTDIDFSECRMVAIDSGGSGANLRGRFVLLRFPAGLRLRRRSQRPIFPSAASPVQ